MAVGMVRVGQEISALAFPRATGATHPPSAKRPRQLSLCPENSSPPPFAPLIMVGCESPESSRRKSHCRRVSYQQSRQPDHFNLGFPVAAKPAREIPATMAMRKSAASAARRMPSAKCEPQLLSARQPASQMPVQSGAAISALKMLAVVFRNLACPAGFFKIQA